MLVTEPPEVEIPGWKFRGGNSGVVRGCKTVHPVLFDGQHPCDFIRTGPDQTVHGQFESVSTSELGIRPTPVPVSVFAKTDFHLFV